MGNLETPKKPDNCFSKSELARMLEIDRRTVGDKLRRLECAYKDGRAEYYNLSKACELIFSNESSASLDRKIQIEQLGIEKARREKLEIEVGQLRGELIPIETIAKTLEKQIGYFRAHIRSLPAKLAKPLSMIIDPAKMFEQLTDSINECLSELVIDAEYQLKRHTARSGRPDLVQGDNDRNETIAETEPSSMGG